MLKRTITIAAISSLALFSTPSFSVKSFECKDSTTKAERIICGNPRLSALDDSLDGDYDDHLAVLRASGLDNDVEERLMRSLGQNIFEWRNNVLNACQTAQCVESAYNERIAEFKKINSDLKGLNQKKQAARKGAEPIVQPKMAPEFYAKLEYDHDLRITNDCIAHIGQYNTSYSGGSKPAMITSFKLSDARKNTLNNLISLTCKNKDTCGHVVNNFLGTERNTSVLPVIATTENDLKKIDGIIEGCINSAQAAAQSVKPTAAKDGSDTVNADAHVLATYISTDNCTTAYSYRSLQMTYLEDNQCRQAKIVDGEKSTADLLAFNCPNGRKHIFTIGLTNAAGAIESQRLCKRYMHMRK